MAHNLRGNSKWQALVSAAAQATEMFDEDELEAFAAEQRAGAAATPTGEPARPKEPDACGEQQPAGRPRNPYPAGLKPGDFIQTTNHFSDIFFEVEQCFDIGDYWHINYYTYDKYGDQWRIDWVNSASEIRQVIPAEMALPVMFKRRLRFKARHGQYDPLIGFAPVGTPLRRDAPPRPS